MTFVAQVVQQPHMFLFPADLFLVDCIGRHCTDWCKGEIVEKEAMVI